VIARNVTCDGCGGTLVADGRPVAPVPASASGCGCAVRAAVASQRAAVERVARAGRLPADAIARIAGGVYDVPRDVLPPRRAALRVFLRQRATVPARRRAHAR